MVWLVLSFFDGQSRQPEVGPRHDETVWTDWANKLPPSRFLVWLAGQISDDLLAHRCPNDTISGLIISVDAAIGPAQCQAERYLHKRAGWLVYAPHMKRVIGIFRHVIRLNLHWCEDLTH